MINGWVKVIAITTCLFWSISTAAAQDESTWSIVIMAREEVCFYGVIDGDLGLPMVTIKWAERVPCFYDIARFAAFGPIGGYERRLAYTVKVRTSNILAVYDCKKSWDK